MLLKLEKAKKSKFRVLIVDDHPIVRQGFANLINQEGDLIVCGEAGDASQALEDISRHKPHVVISDLSLKNESGIELIKTIRAQHPKVPILVVSMHDEALYAERVLKAGAQGYLMKEEAVERIVEGVRQVLKGEVYVSSEIAKTILHHFQGHPKETGSPSVEQLTDRELEIFQLIGRGHGTRQIAQEVHLSVKTVETHREHIKKKLHLKHAPELIKYAVEWAQANKNLS